MKLEKTLPARENILYTKTQTVMKKLLLLPFLVIGLAFAVQAIPAPDRDIGTVSYVMPTDQAVVANFAFLPVQPVVLLEHSTVVYLPMATSAKQTNQCLLTVVPHYKGPQLRLSAINNQTKTEATFT